MNESRFFKAMVTVVRAPKILFNSGCLPAGRQVSLTSTVVVACTTTTNTCLAHPEPVFSPVNFPQRRKKDLGRKT